MFSWDPAVKFAETTETLSNLAVALDTLEATRLGHKHSNASPDVPLDLLRRHSELRQEGSGTDLRIPPRAIQCFNAADVTRKGHILRPTFSGL